MAKAPYLKKYCEVAHFKVWIVNGEYVRDNIDIEFTNYGQHYRFAFIPKDEFWIDKENNEGEEHFFIEHLLVENRIMEQGTNYFEAFEKADKIEKRERNKSKIMQEIKRKRLNDKELILKVHKKLLKDYSGKNIKVWVVNGELVRDIFDTWFTEGGHDLVYKYIPKKEIWIDDDLSDKELIFVLFHELHERRLMSEGWGYFWQSGKKPKITKNQNPNIIKSAHRSAQTIEYSCRHNKEDIKKKLEEEVKKIR